MDRITTANRAESEIDTSGLPNQIRFAMIDAAYGAEEGGPIGVVAWTETRSLLRYWPRHRDTVESLISRIDLAAIAGGGAA